MEKQWYEKRISEEVTQLRRVADALEEILRLVKQDMDRMKKLNEED